MKNLMSFELGNDDLLESLYMSPEEEKMINEVIEASYYYSSDEFNFFEGVQDTTVTSLTSQGMKDSIKNTSRQVGVASKNMLVSAGSAYNLATDAGAKVVKGGWGLLMNLTVLISRAANFIIDKIASLPTAIGNLGHKIGRIIPAIKEKMKGNIALYMTVETLKQLYEYLLINKLQRLVEDISTLSLCKDRWITKRKHRNGANLSVTHVKAGSVTTLDLKNLRIHTKDDLKLAKEINQLIEKIKGLDFTKDTVTISSGAGTVDQYFGKTPIELPLPDGKFYKGNYYQCLQFMVKDLQKYQKDIKTISKAIQTKVHDIQASKKAGDIPIDQRDEFTRTSQNISRVFGIIANIISKTLADIKTIDDFIKQVTTNASPNQDANKIKQNIYNDKEGYKPQQLEQLSTNMHDEIVSTPVKRTR